MKNAAILQQHRDLSRLYGPIVDQLASGHLSRYKMRSIIQNQFLFSILNRAFPCTCWNHQLNMFEHKPQQSLQETRPTFTIWREEIFQTHVCGNYYPFHHQIVEHICFPLCCMPHGYQRVFSVTQLSMVFIFKVIWAFWAVKTKVLTFF